MHSTFRRCPQHCFDLLLLRLFSYGRSQVKAENFLDIFSSCPKLESLSLYCPITSGAFIAAARERIAVGRNGGASLIRKLAIEARGGYGGESGLSLGPLSQLGTAFPELEELAVHNLMLHGDGGAVALGTHAETGSAPRAWAPLPRMQSVRIDNIGTWCAAPHNSDVCRPMFPAAGRASQHAFLSNALHRSALTPQCCG